MHLVETVTFTMLNSVETKMAKYRFRQGFIEVSDAPHSVNISVNVSTKTLTDGHCSCKAGISGECAHLLATIMSIRTWILERFREVSAEQSCTSLPQTWDKPRGQKIQPEPVSQMVVCKPTTLTRKRKPLMASFHDNRKFQITDEDLQYLQNIPGCPISYMAQNVKKIDENQPYGPQFIGSGLSYHAPLMNPVRPPSDVNNACGNMVFQRMIDIEMPSIVTDNQEKWQHLKITPQESADIEKETRDQAGSTTWINLRKNKITASNFGKIMKRKSTVNNKFLGAMFRSQDFVSKPTTYGKTNEKVAKQLYIKQTKNHAHDIGLIINPSVPFLGATPDAKVCDNGESGILEIKCPYSVRDMTLREACADEKYGGSFFLQHSGEALALDRLHKYWYQVQGQLMLSGAPFCDFVTYTKKDLNIKRIFPDRDTFTSLLKKLTSVYIHHVKPYLEIAEHITNNA